MSPDQQTLTEDGLLVATFLLGHAAFGIDAHQVQEVARVGDVTQVHHAPACIVGIRNLRGRIITVMDLRALLELGRVAPAPDNRILIVDGQGEPIGLLVDSVTDTISPGQDELLPPPPNLHGVQSRHLRGVCRAGERLVALLKLETLLQPEDLATPILPKEQLRA
jgi:purine-binding chemotaxis protein CheW